MKKQPEETQTEYISRKAVIAALTVIDNHTGKGAATGPLGDKLAYSLHRTIEKALYEYMGVIDREI